MSVVSDSASELASDVQILNISNATAQGVQLPSFLYDNDTYNEDAPAYSAVPFEQIQQLEANGHSVSPTTDEVLDPISVPVSSGMSAPLPTTETLGHPGGQPTPLNELPIFAQLQPAQQASFNSGSASVYTFGRRLGTCKFFRPTKGYGFLNGASAIHSSRRKAEHRHRRQADRVGLPGHHGSCDRALRTSQRPHPVSRPWRVGRGVPVRRRAASLR
jgi:hypothetical protein